MDQQPLHAAGGRWWRQRLPRWALLAVLGPLVLGCHTKVADEKKASPIAGKQPADPERQNLPNGFYGVLRDEPQQKDVLPVGENRIMVVNNHPYAPKESRGPPRYLVVHRSPDVPLVLASAPGAARDDSGSLRIQLQLATEQAEAVERFTRNHIGKQVAILVGGEVVTVHKIRDAIQGGKLQITCCAEGSCEYLLKQLQDLAKSSSGRKEAK
jgi:preprotein translocase subunit SecD